MDAIVIYVWLPPAVQHMTAIGFALLNQYQRHLSSSISALHSARKIDGSRTDRIRMWISR
jgi:hypothetical protein